MMHLLSKSPKSIEPEHLPTLPANDETASTAFTSGHEVHSTSADTHRRLPVIELLHTITHSHHQPHPPHTDCLHIEPSYFETARMAREMGHL